MSQTLTSRCRRDFSPQDRSRGSDYFRSGQVEQVDADLQQSLAEAVVAGAREYDVLVDWSQARQGRLLVDCDCPRFADGELCKHVWATLLKLDAQGVGQRVPGTQALEVFAADEHEFEDDGEADWQEVDGQFFRITPVGRFGAFDNSSRRGGHGPSRDRRAPAWRGQLERVRQAASSRGQGLATPTDHTTRIKPRELWYVLELTASQRGAIHVYFFQREQKKNGDWGMPQARALSEDDARRLPDPVEARMLSLLLLGKDAASTLYGGYSQYYTSPSKSGVAVPPMLYEAVIPALCATSRFFWKLSTSRYLEDAEARPLAWDDGPAYRVELRVDGQPKKPWRIEASLVRGEESLPLKTAVMALPQGFVMFADRFARLEIGNAAPWLDALIQGPIEIPRKDRATFVKALWSLPEPPGFDLPPELDVERIRESPRGKLSVAKPKYSYGAQGELIADIWVEYGEESVRPRDEGGSLLADDAKRVWIRDHAAEQELLRQAWTAVPGLHALPQYRQNEGDMRFAAKRLPALVDALSRQGWTVEAEGIRFRQPGEFGLIVTSGVDWFELDAKIDFEGVNVALPELLKALRNGEKFVVLDDGSQGLLPEEWLKKYGALADLGEADGDKLKFRLCQGAILDALLAAQPNVDLGAQFREFSRKLKTFEGVKPASEPNGFTGQLRNYQREGLGWLNFLREFHFGGCLADDMGLGKTIQVLALLQDRHQPVATNGRKPSAKKPSRGKPSLVVVPKSLIFNWLEEAQRFAPELKLVTYHGLDRAARLEQAGGEYHVLLTTYGTLRRDIVKLKEQEFDYAILDESQAIKNSNSQAAKAVRLVQAEHRLAMTGTPVENHLGELWSLFEFLNPGMLGRSTAFKSLSRGGTDGDCQDGVPLLAAALRPYILRRTKEQVLTELPEKTEQTLHCELEGKQKQLYDELREYYRKSLTQKLKNSGLAKNKIHVLEALLRLRQAACHPGLIDKKRAGEPSAKLETLLEQLDEVLAEGHKALVFSQFTSLLDIVRKQLDAKKVVYEYLDGNTRDRGARVKRFQEDEACRLFLISLKAGGQGLNLTAADYVFILDPWWNPAVEAQAVDRAHRIGQSRRVFAYRLIAKGTVEEKILELQKSKRDLAEAIVSEDNSVLRNLTAEDLQMLLS